MRWFCTALSLRMSESSCFCSSAAPAEAMSSFGFQPRLRQRALLLRHGIVQLVEIELRRRGIESEDGVARVQPIARSMLNPQRACFHRTGDDGLDLGTTVPVACSVASTTPRSTRANLQVSTAAPRAEPTLPSPQRKK